MHEMCDGEEYPRKPINIQVNRLENPRHQKKQDVLAGNYLMGPAEKQGCYGGCDDKARIIP